jgi:hypothetical protein
MAINADPNRVNTVVSVTNARGSGKART